MSENVSIYVRDGILQWTPRRIKSGGGVVLIVSMERQKFAAGLTLRAWRHIETAIAIAIDKQRKAWAI